MFQDVVYQRKKKEPESLVTLKPQIQPTLETAFYLDFMTRANSSPYLNHFDSGLLFLAARSILIRMTDKSKKIEFVHV